MNWKRWKVGLVVAAVTGLLTGVIAWSDGMSTKALMILIAVSIAKDMLLFLKDHPVEEALIDGDRPAVAKVIGLLGIVGLMGLMFLGTGCRTSTTTVTYQLRADGTTNSVTTVSKSAPFYDRCIIKNSTRFFGFQFKEDPKTQIPYAVLGWGSEVNEIVPTTDGTNGISAPRTMTAFTLKNSLNPFATDIQENSGAGEVYIGGTNDTSKAIVPSPFMLPQK